jgi:hypothetical protein
MVFVPSLVPFRRKVTLEDTPRCPGSAFLYFPAPGFRYTIRNKAGEDRAKFREAK